MTNIRVYAQHDTSQSRWEYETFVFNGGEIQVKFANQYALGVKSFVIFARLINSEEIFRLALVKDALERTYPNRKIALVMPYIPYARQDRICDAGESFSLKVFTDFLNALNFEVVVVFDPHSDVAPALINNVEIIDQAEIISKYYALTEETFVLYPDKHVLVSPDAGANKKTAKIAGKLGLKNFIRADKLRDMKTGKIIETVVYCDDLNGKNVVIIDDLCENGGTFIALAAALKAKNCGKVILYVTHGIFPSGVDKLFASGIDEIYTTNSFKSFYDDRVYVFDIEIESTYLKLF